MDPRRKAALDRAHAAWHPSGRMSESLVGRMLGAYRIERALGQGGMGAVYIGRHARTGRAYAVKVLLAEHAGQRDALQRFRREAEALSAVGHAHIVSIHDYDETPDGLWFLVMDLLEGEDLAHRLARGPIDWRAAIELLDPIASAIQTAHAMGLIHRDLKPSNVFLARVPGAASEKPMLLDFGLARAFDDQASAAGKLTATGTVMGTPSYMSPEQAQGIALDGRSDLWALGILLFEMIAGRPPFEGPTLTSTLVAVLTTPRPRLNDRGFPVPEALEAVLDRALQKQPSDRYPDVASFRAALHELARGRATQPGHLDSRPLEARASGVEPTQALASVPRTSELSVAPTQTATPRTAQPAAIGAAVTPTAGTSTGAPTPHTPVAAMSAPATASVLPWVVLGLGAMLLLAGGGATIAYFLVTGRPAVVSVGAPTTPTNTSSAPTAPLPPTDAPSEISAPETRAPEIAETEIAETETAETETAETERARSRRTVRSPGERPEERTDERTEAAPVEAPPPAAPPPMGGPPPELVRATDRMGEGDFVGCLRELEHAGTSAPILGARMNCALRTGRRSDLEDACALLHQHHPAHAYTRTCDTLLSVSP